MSERKREIVCVRERKRIEEREGENEKRKERSESARETIFRISVATFGRP